MLRYYELRMADAERWHLELMDKFPDGSDVDIWAYRRCQWLRGPKPVPFTIQVDGKRVDYNPTAFSPIVVSRRMADCLARVCPEDLQRIPAVVQGDTNEWEVINVLSSVDCIDHAASMIQYFPPDHPTKPGEPRGVVRLVLDPRRVGRHHIFHPTEWHVATVVSAAVKTAFERIEATGIEYVPVTE